MPDRYSYPNSDVLINKLGITDYDRWKAVETAAIHQRMVELTEHPIPGQFDLITTFDVVHDMPRPRPAMQEIRKALKPDGTYFVLEFNFYGDLQQNIDHPLGIGAFGYSASVNYCMTQALAAGGEGTGTCMGEAKMREFAAEGGFTHFRRLDFPANPFNLFYEIRP